MFMLRENFIGGKAMTYYKTRILNAWNDRWRREFGKVTGLLAAWLAGICF
jgi:hypothetical protein